jgi:hypothetical protein
VGIVSARIRVESGTRHALAWCTECPSWRELRGTRTAVHLLAADHSTRVHGDAAAAATHRRHAEESRTVHGKPPTGLEGYPRAPTHPV